MKFVTWNLEWANPDSARGRELKRRLLEQEPDVAILTETTADFMAGAGYVICSEALHCAEARELRRSWSWLADSRVGFMVSCAEAPAEVRLPPALVL